MEVSAEAKRVMVQALSKLYSSRAQRGGLRLHRSLLLTLVMKSARDIYHTARLSCEHAGLAEEQRGCPPAPPQGGRGGALGQDAPPEGGRGGALGQDAPPEGSPICEGSREDKENRSPAPQDRHARKRRSKASAEPDFLPSKKARMELVAPLRSSHAANSACRSGDTFCPLPVAHVIPAC